MSGVVIANGLVLSPGEHNLNSDSPIIGYRNLITAANIAATTEEAPHPAVHLGNPATHLFWRSVVGSPAADETVTATLDTIEPIDYLAIARHNLGSARLEVSVEGQATDGGPWLELIGGQMLPDNGPVIFRFAPQSLYALRLRILAPAVPVEIGVIYAGLLLTLQRRIYVGHTPLKYGREIQTANPRSISGAFLGRIVLGEKRVSSVALANLTPAWYRAQLDPFILAAQERPFFFAWRPGSYPHECGYAWLSEDPKPSNQRPNGMMQVTLEMEGIA